MFFFLGHKLVSRSIGAPETLYCDTCERERSHRLTASYDLNHIMGVCRWARHVAYRMRCEICSRGKIVNVSELSKKTRHRLVPFFDRNGWAISLAVVVGLGAALTVAVIRDGKLDDEQVQNPRVGDTYEVDLARMVSPNGYVPPRYALMRVDQVSAQNLTVRIGRTACDQFGCAYRDLSRGPVADGYYGEEAYVLPRSQVIAMRKDGLITYVERYGSE